MTSNGLVVTPGDRRPTLDVIGVQVTVLVSDAECPTQQITLQAGGERVGPPPHSHTWDESFYVTRGQVEFTCGDKSATCGVGTLVHVPAGTVHAFSFGPGGGEMLEITGAGSQAVRMFTALAREIPPGPLDVPKVVEVAGAYGVAFHL